MARTETVVAGDRTHGRLFKLGTGRYEGERLTKGGKFEAKRFEGQHRKVMAEWDAWRREVDSEAFLRVNVASQNANVTKRPEGTRQPKQEPRKEERPMPIAQTQKSQAAKPPIKKVYILRYIVGKTSRNVAAFMTQDAALSAAELLNDLGGVMNDTGDFEFDELEVRG